MIPSCPCVKNLNAETLPRLPRGLPVPVACAGAHRLLLIYLLFVNQIWEYRVFKVASVFLSMCLIDINWSLLDKSE